MTIFTTVIPSSSEPFVDPVTPANEQKDINKHGITGEKWVQCIRSGFNGRVSEMVKTKAGYVLKKFADPGE